MQLEGGIMIPYQVLRKRAKDDANRTVFVDADGDVSVAFGELLDRVERVAAGLREIGIGKGDVVGALLPNCMELVELYVACGAVGAVFQPMDVRFRGTELQNCLTNTAVRALFAWAPFIDQNLKTHVPKEIVKIAVRGGHKEWTDYSALREENTSAFSEIDIENENTPALYLYTSGSTSTIKCVPMTWRQLDFFPQDMISIWAINERDRGLSLLPMSHISGPIVINLALASKSSYVLTNRFSAGHIAHLIQEHQVTWTHTVPAIGRMILQAARKKREALKSLRLLALMGTTVPPVLFEQIMDVLPSAVVIQGYGLTETSPLLTLQQPDWPRNKITSIGKALSDLEIRIIDEQGNPVPDGRPGEIVVRGPRIFRGYEKNEELNRKIFRDGWFHTKDVGIRDSTGCYFHLGRLDDVIITGGLKVYPGEIENELLQHPAVSECVAYGEEDLTRGKVVATDIVPRPGATIDPVEMREFLSSRLASYKIPRIFRQVETLAYTPVGKPIRDHGKRV